jgi:hypothetical protein
MGRSAKLFWWGELKERDNLDDLGIDGSVILKWGWEGRDWINVVHGKDKWWAVVSVVVNTCVIYIYMCVCVCVCVDLLKLCSKNT